MKALNIMLSGLVFMSITSPVAAEDIRSLLAAAAKTAGQAEAAEEYLKETLQAIIDVGESINAHNATGCTASQYNPSACDGFNQEADALNERKADLVQKGNDKADELGVLRQNLSMKLAVIRIQNKLKNCDCGGKDTLEAETTCYKVCWENAYDAGYTVPGPAY